MRRAIFVLPILGLLLAIAGVSTIPGAIPGAHVFMGARAPDRGVSAVKTKVSGPEHKDSPRHPHEPGHPHEAGENERPEGIIEMTAGRVEASQITVGDAAQGTLARRMTAPGVVIPDSGRIARVAAQVAGTVAEMRKRLGDAVSKDEVVAVIGSREVADAKSEYLAAAVNLELQRTLFERAQTLWDKRVSAEQQYLQARAAFTQAELRADLARQKLSSLGLDAKLVAAAAKEDAASGSPSRLRTYEVRAPMSGRVVERKVDVGAPVGREGDASELYAIADLSTAWVELAVPLADLESIREGQQLVIRNGQRVADGKIVFVSPIINQDTRSARVVAAFDNVDMSWRLGTFVTAQIAVDEQQVDIRVPRTALQSLDGKQVVFVRTEAGFQKREVTLGKLDDEAVEIISGLSAGEKLAISNTFLLKAELGKAEAEHSH